MLKLFIKSIFFENVIINNSYTLYIYITYFTTSKQKMDTQYIC